MLQNLRNILDYLNKIRYIWAILSFIFFLINIFFGFDLTICLCEDNEDLKDRNDQILKRATSFWDKIFTKQEQFDLIVMKEVFFRVLKMAIFLVGLYYFSILLFFMILVFDIANANNYERYKED